MMRQLMINHTTEWPKEPLKREKYTFPWKTEKKKKKKFTEK